MELKNNSLCILFKNMEKIVEEYSQELKKLGIKHEIMEHPPMREAIDVQKFFGVTLAESIPTLIMKADDKFVAILKKGDTKLDSAKIKKILGVQSLRMAKDEEFEKVTGVPIGAARVYNPGLKTYIDHHVFDKEYLNGGTGSFVYTFKYKTADLKKIPNSQIIDVAEVRKEEKEIVNIGTILTGITPSGSGQVHIGNYFGAVKQMLNLSEKAEKVYFFIADLHALTTIHNKEELQRNVENQVLSYLAFGLDLSKVVFYRQSDIPMHTELQSILNNITPLGLIKRCHAYKDKLAHQEDEENINMGLFSYPVLMAADILLYDADYVPVGEDQRQHIEVTRDIAEYFNSTYGGTFKLPDIYLVRETARLIGTDGVRKMSKSLGNVISVFEDEAKIKKQIMGCYTDPTRLKPTDPGHVEGNPVFIYHDLINENRDEVEDLKARYREGTVGDVEVKEKLFVALMSKFKEERERYKELKANPQKIKEILANGAEKARQVAAEKMKDVREKIGITNKYSNFE
jgi:tryptophanyl-tRNA synthetase